MTAQSAPRILLVEDSFSERLRLSCMLQNMGYTTVEVADGHAALAVLADKPCDIILSDWRMPGLDGLSLCRQVKDDDTLGQPYFIMLTGQSAPADLIAGMDAGADDFIAKPASHEELRVRLQAGMRNLQLRHEAERRSEDLQSALNREQAELKRLRQDLDAAARLQQSMLPKLTALPADLKAAYLYQPADAVGGDALGIHDVGNELISFFSVDCCGHGIAAAMQSIGIGQQLTPEKHADRLSLGASQPDAFCPATVLRTLNTIQCETRSTDAPFTAVYGVFDRLTGVLRLCVAGHPQPLILRAEGELDSVATGGLPLGVTPDAEYTLTELVLAPGDHLLLYSDGLFDRGGRGRDCDALRQAYADTLQAACPNSPQAVIAHTENWLDNSPTHDDISLLVIGR